MNLFAHSVRSKGGRAFVRRFGSIASRFGLTAAKTDRNLQTYVETLQQFGCNATFPITAVVLRRHPSLIRHFRDEGVEFAVHGYIHTDHTLLSQDEQRRQMAQALDTFHKCDIPVDGFRSPYLRGNNDTIAAARSLGFSYISNETITYDVLDRGSIPPERWSDYEKALNLYSAVPSNQTLARPRFVDGLIEVPVSMPDDEILVDRLGFTDATRIGQVWADLVHLTYAMGDLLTLQLHPERGIACQEALIEVLATARQKARPVWFAQLRDIAAWWRRRVTFQLDVTPVEDGRWRIIGPTDSDATIILKNMTCPTARPWSGPDLVLEGRECVVSSERMPTIGVSPESTSLQLLLQEEGYSVVVDRDPQRYSVYLDQSGTLTLSEQAEIVHRLDRSTAPLVRLGRWPSGARSAISVTGDIDALTLGDFFLRAWEVR